jgi:VWFA-related protein
MTVATPFKVLTAVALASFPPLTAAAEDIRFRDKVEVERVVIDARALDNRGRPILGLTAADFRVKVDGKPVALESATWIAGTAPDQPVAPVEGGDAGATGDVVVGGLPPGRLIVFFFQKDFDSSRLPGLLRMQHKAVKFLETLGPEDRVAVMSFDTHLKLWQDFTADHAKLRRAIRQSVFFGKLATGQSVDEPSLAANFDFEAAQRAASPETALLVTARALQPLPGSKSLVFFGWGMGTLSWPLVFLDHDYGPARQALLDARTTVFSLDVTDADYHTLEVGLEQVAADTGGFYARTHDSASLAMARLEGALAGHYLLGFEKPPYRRGPHRVEVKLAGIKGSVLAKDSYAD